MRLTPNQRMALIALAVVGLDQGTKWLVLREIPYGDEKTVIEGFFKLVHWGNTGAAWSFFTGFNSVLAIVSLLAFLGLFLFRHHFSADHPWGQFGLGLLFGGIIGNLYDRLHPARNHVIDFLYFHLRRNGEEIGFPAFNVADSAICVGVGILFVLSWRGNISSESRTRESEVNDSQSEP